jgi:Tol biopolymer transport system component
MTRQTWTGPLVLATAIGILAFAAEDPGLTASPSCTAGLGLCYEEPVNAGPLVNTPSFEGGPALSQDGLTLLFSSVRRNSLGRLDEDLYIATRESTSDPFGPAQNLGPSVNALGFADFSPHLSLDGLTLYFGSSRLGGIGGPDLYVTTRESPDAPWEPPQNLGPNVNSPAFDGQPSLSANGKTLYWDSDRPDGFGDFDIWMATRDNVGLAFEPAVNAGAEVNTVGPEFGPASLNSNQLFFSSARPGNVGEIDIWVVERQTKLAPWGNAINLDSLNSLFFQAMPTFRGNGREVCFMSSRPGGFVGIDIWCANRVH